MVGAKGDMKMRRFLVLAAAGLLAACEPGVVSEQPLVKKGGSGEPAPGLWALLAQKCPAPTSGAIGRWPSCAIAVWLVDGEATVFNQGKPIHAPYVFGGGEPRLIQFEFLTRDLAQSSGIEFGPPDPPAMIMPIEPGAEPEPEPAPAPDAEGDEVKKEGPFYAYWSFVPEGAPPFRRGRAWQIQCPDRAMPGIEKEEGASGCAATTLDGLRSLAGPPGQAELVLDAVWVADAR
jgi:hypothetical protein